jgi:hypothetical protein
MGRGEERSDASDAPLSPEQIEELCKVLGREEGRRVGDVANSDMRQPANIDEITPLALRRTARLLLDPKTSDRGRRRATRVLLKWARG